MRCLHRYQSTNQTTPLQHHNLQRALQRQHNRRPARDIHLQEVLAFVPCKRRGEEARALIDVAVAAKRLCIGAEHDAVCTFLLDADAVIREAVLGMEVEDPQQARTLKHNDLVALVLEGDVSLRGVQPSVFLLCPLHLGVEFVEVAVAQEGVVDKVELAARVGEGVVVTFAGEVEPLWVAELVAFEVEVAFAAEAVGNEADHFVQGETAVDNGGEFGEVGHVGVHFGVAEPEEEGFVAHQPVDVSTRMYVALG
jgi:hypothetical protein